MRRLNELDTHEWRFFVLLCVAFLFFNACVVACAVGGLRERVVTLERHR